MWIVFHKGDRKVMGMSAHGALDLDKESALSEVVKGLVNPESPDEYDAVQISDPAQIGTLLTMPIERVAVMETQDSGLQLTTRESKLMFLLARSDAPHVHPVDGIPVIPADGTSFTTITVQKVDENGKPRQGLDDNDLVYLRTDYGTIRGTDGITEIASIRLDKGQAAIQLVSEKVKRLATVQVFNADPNLQDDRILIEFV